MYTENNFKKFLFFYVNKVKEYYSRVHILALFLLTPTIYPGKTNGITIQVNNKSMRHKFAISTLKDVCRFLLRPYAHTVIPFPTVPNTNTNNPITNPKYRMSPKS